MPASPSRPLIVILENDQHLANALALLTHDWGYMAVSARSASIIARTLGPRIVDVCAIVADYHLDDGFTGVKAASAIAKAIGHRVPTIVTTAHLELAEREDVFPVLCKPFDPGVLHRWLDDHVSRTTEPYRSNLIGSEHAMPARCDF
jgi:CheY-like chemotaxis protein